MSCRLKVRLSRPYDYDLYCLYLSTGKKEFAKTAKDILAAYINKEEIEIPIIKEWVIPVMGDKGVAVTCNFSFTEEDKQIISLLEKIPEKKRASFIKTVLRIYYADQLLQVYFFDKEAETIHLPKRKVPEKQDMKQEDSKEEKIENEPSSFEEKIQKEEAKEEEENNIAGTVTGTKEEPLPDFNELGNLFGNIHEK